MLAIIGAMKEEVDALAAGMRISDRQSHAGIDVVRGHFQDTELVLAQSGIGKVNATICTQMLIDRFQPDALIFSGVAGGLLPNMRVGDLVIASHLIQYDMDLTAFGRRHGELPGKDRMIESDPDLVKLAAEAFDAAFPDPSSGPSLMLGTVVSGDRFIQDPEELRWLQREFSALATEMEGAAVGYTCNLNEVPFVVVRGLTDTAGNGASTDFAANLATVCDNCFGVLQSLIPAVGASQTIGLGAPIARDCRAAS
jgi:adenosylhomocysteine nucleosidase